LSEPDAINKVDFLETLDGQDLDKLIPEVYAELKRLAAHHLHNERPNHTLHPTELVHEVLLDTFNQRFGTLLVWLGEAETLKGNTEAADDYYRQSLEYHRQQLYYEEILIPLGFYGQTNRRPLADAYSNVAASLIKLRRYDEALKNVETALSLIQNMQRNDPDNRELILDEVVALNNKQKIFTAQGEFDSALKEIETALDLAEDLYRRDRSNFEPISWIGNLAADAARLSHNQKKEKEAEKYRQIFFDYEKQYKEKFGRYWRHKL
jgi:tetratricopeptide (TPR) repeat protein